MVGDDNSVDRSGRSWATRRRALGLGAFLIAATLAASSLNPVLAMGTENRLESTCPTEPGTERKAASWTYERSSWTPFLWSCTITSSDGTVESYTPWRLFG
jgi:hypothetical protein